MLGRLTTEERAELDTLTTSGNASGRPGRRIAPSDGFICYQQNADNPFRGFQGPL